MVENKGKNIVEETEAVEVKKTFSETKKLLDNQKKRYVRIPKSKDKHDINYVPVCINGYIYQVQKGIAVEVPETVAQLLEEGGYLDA